MARGVPFTDAERMKIRTLHGKAWSATRIAKEIGRPTRSVTRVAEQMDLHFDHAQTAAATQAAAIDMRARRAALAARLLAEGEGLLDDLKRSYVDHTFTVSGAYVEHAAMPTPQDKAHLTRSASSVLGEHRRMAEFDAEEGVAGARNLLGSLSEALGVAAANLGEQPENGDSA